MISEAALVLLADLADELSGPEFAWMSDALCAQVDPEIFFPTPVSPTTREAKRVCMACEVRPACLEHALGLHIADGVFGGKSERERRQIAASRRERAA